MIQYYNFLRTLEQVSQYERRLTLGEISITYGSLKKFTEKIVSERKNHNLNKKNGRYHGFSGLESV